AAAAALGVGLVVARLRERGARRDDEHARATVADVFTDHPVAEALAALHEPHRHVDADHLGALARTENLREALEQPGAGEYAVLQRHRDPAFAATIDADHEHAPRFYHDPATAIPGPAAAAGATVRRRIQAVYSRARAAAVRSNVSMAMPCAARPSPAPKARS